MMEPPAWIKALGEGIAKAEGFGIEGKIPTTHNNPGDVTDSSGNKIWFDSVVQGYDALYRQIELAVSGNSQYYYPSMTLSQFAQVWTGGDNWQDWINTVLDTVNSKLGTNLTQDNTLADLANV